MAALPALSPSHARLGRAVRAMRDERGLSQEDLAHAAQIHTTYLSGIERGQRNPTWTVLIALSRALGVTVAELAARAETRH